MDKYAPNGTPDDLKLGILHSVDNYYVSNEGTKSKPNFHVWVPGITHSTCDSAYNDLSLAVCRCNYLAKNNMITKIKYKDMAGKLPSLELMKLYSAGMKAFPGSKKHKEILRQIANFKGR